MLNKMIRKIGVSNSFYKILKKIYRSEEVDIDYDEAYKKMDSLRENSKDSSITDEIRWKSDYIYDVDIIMPVYNTQKYLKKSIESVLNQKTNRKIRLIIVNDGSPDDSQSIINDYLNDERVLAITKENGGLSSARNRGLSEANSKYIMFIDSDDELVDNSLDKLIECAEENMADITEGGHYMVSAEGKTKSTLVHKNKINASSNELFGYAWGKLYKSDLWDNICFPNYLFEDSIVRVLINPRARKICTSDIMIYKYRENKKSISHTLKNDFKCIDTIWITEALLRDRKTIGIKIDKQYIDYFSRLVRLCYMRTEHIAEEYKKNLFSLLCGIYENEICSVVLEYNMQNDLFNAFEKKDYKLYKLYCIFH